MGQKGRYRHSSRWCEGETSWQFERNLRRKRKSRMLTRDRNFSRIVKTGAEHLADCSCPTCVKADPIPAFPVRMTANSGTTSNGYQKFHVCPHDKVRSTCSACRTLTFLLCLRQLRKQDDVSLPREIARLIVSFLKPSSVLACNRCCTPFESDAHTGYCSTSVFDTGRGVYLSGWYGSYLDNEWACFVDGNDTPRLPREFRELYLQKRVQSTVLPKLKVCNHCISEMLNSGEIEACDRPCF
jgi:hypothetical protein